jgi:hypothetical protein
VCSHNSISDDGAAALSNAVAGHTALRELYLRRVPSILEASCCLEIVSRKMAAQGPFRNFIVWITMERAKSKKCLLGEGRAEVVRLFFVQF